VIAMYIFLAISVLEGGSLLTVRISYRNAIFALARINKAAIAQEAREAEVLELRTALIKHAGHNEKLSKVSFRGLHSNIVSQLTQFLGIHTSTRGLRPYQKSRNRMGGFGFERRS